MFDVLKFRSEFPILQRSVNNQHLVYLDNAATTQKPAQVIDALQHYYAHYNANIHRGIHTLAEEATLNFENARLEVSKFLGVQDKSEIIFTKGTSEGINLVAWGLGQVWLNPGDEVLISTLEHHSNIVPWQRICTLKGAKLKVIPLLPSGDIDMDAYQNMLSSKTRIVSVNHVSNSLGCVNPIKDIIDQAHSVDAKVFIDGAQAVAHLDVDVEQLGCDFYAFSAHKMYGPTGVGVLYGKRSCLEMMEPYQCGGEMIKEVSFEKTTYNEIPYKFEAGTPNIAGVIGMGAAISFIQDWNKQALLAYEETLMSYAKEVLSDIKQLHQIATPKKQLGAISFNLKDIHPFDVGQMLDAKGVAVRTGHHCTQPLMTHYGIEGTVRISLAPYNTKEELQLTAKHLEKIISFFNR